MTKVLLIRPFWKKKIRGISMTSPPMGLVYLATALEEAGHEAKIIDLKILETQNYHINRLIDIIKPDLIGITAVSYHYNEMIEICSYIKDIPVVLGGVHPTVLPELTLKQTNAKYLVIGEGEKTLIELANYVDNGGDIKKIKGLAFKKGGKIVFNEPRPPIQNLDELPFPDWDFLKLEKYHPKISRGYPVYNDFRPYLPVITSRGCPFRCKFCASTAFWGNTIRFRSITNVINEIEFNVKKYGIKSIELWDDNFTLKRKRVIEFCKEIVNRNLKVAFYIPNGVRIDTLNRPLIKMMKIAGFKGFSVCPESGSQKILDNVNKQLDLSIVKEVTKILQEERIIVWAYFILGLPGETAETALKTVKFGASLHVNGVGYFIFTPHAGSELFNEWKKNIELEKINWSELDYFMGASCQLNKKPWSLSIKDMKKFQKLALIYYILKPKNILNYIKRFLNRFFLYGIVTNWSQYFELLFKK